MDIAQDEILTVPTDSGIPMEVARIHSIYNTISDNRKRNLCNMLIKWASEELEKLK